MTRRARTGVVLTSVFAAAAGHASDCAALATHELSRVHITSAQLIPAQADVPEFCRVQGEAHPTADSQIGFEVWLPASGWNGRYYQLGNGGFAGNIHQPALVAELRRGNAVAATDTGHRANAFDASWALNHPERIIDYGYRSLHETSRVADDLLHAYYGRPARFRYFTGCSNGGRQAFMAAQRFPDEWDGILAGAPAYNWTLQLATFAAKPAGDVRAQLTFAEQFFRYFVHDDPAWTLARFDSQRDFAFARQRRIGNQTLSQVLDATDIDLTRYEQRRGKLLMYFGWADDLISPQAGVDYYERVVARMGGSERTQAFFRLFMVPGMGHCQGGAAPHAFGQAYVAPGMSDDPEHDIRRALEAWVERGTVPERIVEAAQVLQPYKPKEEGE
jgi:pimeloyl-ACP methyl ester carboxylesterase